MRAKQAEGRQLGDDASRDGRVAPVAAPQPGVPQQRVALDEASGNQVEAGQHVTPPRARRLVAQPDGEVGRIRDGVAEKLALDSLQGEPLPHRALGRQPRGSGQVMLCGAPGTGHHVTPAGEDKAVGQHGVGPSGTSDAVPSVTAVC